MWLCTHCLRLCSSLFHLCNEKSPSFLFVTKVQKSTSGYSIAHLLDLCTDISVYLDLSFFLTWTRHYLIIHKVLFQPNLLVWILPKKVYRGDNNKRTFWQMRKRTPQVHGSIRDLAREALHKQKHKQKKSPFTYYFPLRLSVSTSVPASHWGKNRIRYCARD